jgi:hypothetical protein
VVPEKSSQYCELLLIGSPYHQTAQVKPEGDDDMQEHEYSVKMGAQGATIHDDM